MPALIPELIAMASEPTVKTTDLLRKALVAARQLRQPEWAAWINHELQGYPDGVELPAYRRLRGELVANNPARGWIPLHADSPELVESLTACKLSSAVSELEDLASSDYGARVSIPPILVTVLLAMQEVPMTPAVSLGASKLRSLLDAVRNQVLMWSLDLADAGIQGEGMSFTPQEQQQAQQLAPVSIYIGGNATGFQFMQSSPGGQQQQTVTGEQKAEALTALLAWLAQEIAEGTLSPSVQADLQANHTALQALANAPTPSWPVIETLANSVRAILEGAGGGVLTAQALGWLATLSGS